MWLSVSLSAAYVSGVAAKAPVERAIQSCTRRFDNLLLSTTCNNLLHKTTPQQQQQQYHHQPKSDANAQAKSQLIERSLQGIG